MSIIHQLIKLSKTTPVERTIERQILAAKMRKTGIFASVFLFILFLASIKCHLYNDWAAESKLHKQCENITREVDDGPCFIPREKGILTRLHGVKVGHIQEADLGPDGKRMLITRALKPLLFEIPNFLSDDECDHIVSLANDSKLVRSIAKGGLTKDDNWKFNPNLYGRADGPKGLYENWDFDQDGNITINEIKEFARIHRYLYLNDQEVKRIFEDLNLPELDDDVITHEEFEDLNTILIDSYLYEMGRTHPRHRERFSEQTWLTNEHEDSILQGIRLSVGWTTLTSIHTLFHRVQSLTKLPDEIIYGSEYLQVVRYEVDGHYHAHFDSETHKHPDIPCCHQIPMAGVDGTKCKLCRYATILYFLNDVPKGGETAFPMADNATFDKEYLEKLRSQEDFYNLSEFCHKSNLVFSPRKGTAVLWYNHEMDADSGWLGKRDIYSIHGGCAVKAGIKWIANNWITAPYKNKAHVPSQYVLGPEISFSED